MQGKNPTTGKMSIDLRVGETLRVGDALIRLERKDGRRVRLMVQAPRTTKIQPPAKPRAQECASSPHWGSKEQAHVRAAASM